MGDPPSQRGVVAGPEVVVDDAQDDVDVDTSRWAHLAEAVTHVCRANPASQAEGRRVPLTASAR
jgi:hypothetical protein